MMLPGLRYKSYLATAHATIMQRSFSDLEYAAKKKLTRRDRFLAQIDRATQLGKLHKLIEPHYPKVSGPGRPPIGLARMLLKTRFTTAKAICGFVGIDLNIESAPDATTLLKFRHLLEAKDITPQIFATINAYLADQGWVMLVTKGSKSGKKTAASW